MTDPEFLETHGWTRPTGVRPRRQGGPIYWLDHDPNTLERLVTQGQAVRTQKRRNERDGIKR